MADHRRNQAHRQSTMMATGGLLVALSVVLMLTGGLIPIMTYVSPLLAGLILLPLLVEFGQSVAWTAWGATSLIVLLLGVDREAAFFYLFIGYFPILKWRLDRIRRKGLRNLCKIGVFTISFAAMYSILAFVLRLDAILKDFGEMGIWMSVVFFVMLIVCMMVYDRLLLPLMLVYENRIRPKLKLGRR